ncbi:MAG: PAS domain-containing protein [Bacteroidales bacterium]|nr:PAS domain-containing protein [Bacteroidales bacterium]MBN2819631.1 PAS domain-containing protein [Bacteroidales bacterium]
MLNNLITNIKPNLQSSESELLFKSVLEISGDAIFILNKTDFSIHDCNQAALNLFEASNKSELINKSAYRLYNIEPSEFGQEKLTKDLETKGEYTQEMSFRTLKQNIFWGRLTQKNLGFTGLDYSILKVEKSANFLQEEAWLSEVLRVSSVSTGRQFFKDITKVLNKTFDSDYAFIARRISGDNSRMKIFFIQGGDIQTKVIPTENSFIENTIRGYVSYYPTGLSELFPEDKLILETNTDGYIGAPFMDASKEVMGVIGVLSKGQMKEIPNSRYMLNILASRTSAEMHRIRSKEILRQQTKILAEINQMKDKLLSFISNDLQAPLNTLLGFSGMIRNKIGEYNPEELFDKIEVMDNSLRNLYLILENLSDWSRLQQEQVKVHLQENNLGNIFEDTKPFVKYISDLKKLTIINKIPSALRIKADKYLSRSVFKNLSAFVLKNTLKDGHVCYDTLLKDGVWTISIRTDNSAIDVDEINFVLNSGREEFYSSSDNLSIPALGVYISKEFMKKQNGKLHFRSNDKEAEFLLEFLRV